MIQILPDDDLESLKRRNRLRKLAPKIHRIAHESGRSTKNILRIIAGRASGAKKK